MRAWWLLGLMACGAPAEEEAPVVAAFSVDDPLPGAFVPANEVTVSGVARGVSKVTVDGVDAVITGDTFTGTATLARGLNLIEVVATQDDGDVMYVRHGVHAGPTAPAKGGAPYADAAELRLNQSGLDLLMEMAEDLVDLIDPVSLLASDTTTATGPLVSVPIDVFGIGLGTLTADIPDTPDAVAIEGLELTATPQANGYLWLDATVENIHAELYIEIDFPLVDFWDADFTVKIDTGVEARIIASLDVVDGALDVNAGLDEPQFTLVGFEMNTEDLLGIVGGPILDLLAGGFVEDLLRDLVVEQAAVLLPGLLDGVLADLPLAFELDLTGEPLALEAFPTVGGIDEDGIFLGADLAVDAGATCPAGVGHLVAPDVAPTPSRSPDVGAAIGDELVNGLLLDLWCSGLLELELSSDDPELGTMVALLLEPLQVEEGTVSISAGLPPVLVARDGGLVLQVSELLMTIDTPGRVLGENITVMLHVDADLTVSIVDNAPRLVIGDARITTMSRSHDWGASHEATTQLMEAALGDLLATLPALLNVTLAGLLGEPLPLDLFGLSIAEATVGRDAGGSHLSMDITLGYDPDGLPTTFTGF